MKIGQVAKTAGLSVETIRYYESRVLLPEPVRSPSGYRSYTGEVLQRLAFISRGKGLGFSLEEIKELLDLELSPESDSAEVKGLVEEKLTLIENKIRELTRLKSSLADLSASCDGKKPREKCPILGFLKEGDS